MNNERRYLVGTMAFVTAAMLSVAALGGRLLNPDETTIRIAAASSLAPALEDAEQSDRIRGPGPRAWIIGASGTLVQQIQRGAPFDLLLTADETARDAAVATGRCRAVRKTALVRGGLVAITRPGLVTDAKDLSGLAKVLVGKLAIANPEHAPYGRAARQALEHSGTATAFESHLVYASDIRDAARLVRTGQADGALIASALVTANERVLFEVPSSLFDPLEAHVLNCAHPQRAVVADRVADSLWDESVLSVLYRHGYLPPIERGLRAAK